MKVFSLIRKCWIWSLSQEYARDLIKHQTRSHTYTHLGVIQTLLLTCFFFFLRWNETRHGAFSKIYGLSGSSLRHYWDSDLIVDFLLEIDHVFIFAFRRAMYEKTFDLHRSIHSQERKKKRKEKAEPRVNSVYIQLARKYLSLRLNCTKHIKS